VNVKNISVFDISVVDRYRQDMGDLDTLVESMRDLGLLQPIVVMPKAPFKRGCKETYRLVIGARRFFAAGILEWKEIPANVAINTADVLLALRAERDENTCRKDFTPSEAVALGNALEEMERKEAKKRQGGAGRDRSSKLDERSRGRTDEKVAEAVGMKKDTYRKAKAVVEAAEADPELQPVVEEMDRTGKVDPAYREAKAKPQKSAAEPAEAKQRREEKSRIDLEKYFDRWLGESEGRLTKLPALDDDACSHLTDGERFYLDKLVKVQKKLLARLHEIRDKAKAKKGR
jgi:ParB-like chromosome segregation protein Spo0J